MKTNAKFDGITTFAIDCDEVLRALLDNMVALYNEEFDDNVSRDDIKDFNVEVSFPKIKEVTSGTASDWFFQKNGYRLFACSPALPNVKEAIDTLRKHGQVIIVTYQKSYKNKIDTLNWLMENELDVDGICFLKNKTLLHCSWLIDDNWWNFLGCNAEHGVLISAPYNKDTNLGVLIKQTNCNELYRFETLKEFADWYVLEEIQREMRHPIKI